MYPVTERWKIENERPLRNASYVKVVFGIQDPDASTSATMSDNGHLVYSAVEDVSQNVAPTQLYQTLEWNRFVLDGNNPLPDASDPIYQAYVGNEISGANGVWEVQPQITIDFTAVFEFAGLTFQFDEGNNEYPKEMRLTAYKDGVTVYDETLHPDSAYYVSPSHIPLCNKIEIRYVSSKIPRRRARLLYFVFGIVQELYSDDLTTCESKKEVDLLSSKFPKQDFTFTILDSKRMYDPENPNGVWEYLETRQPVSYYYGFGMNDGSVEWIPWGESYTTGNFTVTGQDNVSNVTVPCTGLIEYLNQEYDQGVYSAESKSLYDLAMEVINYSGFVSAIELDDSLKTIYTKMPLPVKKVNECLQMIANAGRCIMSHTRGGYITIRREKTEKSDFGFTFHNMRNAPSTTKIPPLRTLTTQYTDVQPETEVSYAVENTKVDGATGGEYVFTHDGYTGLTAEVSSGLTIVGTPRFYAYKTYINLNGTGTVSIKGKKLRKTNMEYSKTYNEIGEDLSSVRNELVGSLQDAMAYADWVAGITLRRISYKSSDIGYPELDPADIIGVESNFQTDGSMSLTKYTTKFNGGISGEFEGIIGSDV